MVMGEVLEHMDNPVTFLNIIHKKYAGNIDKLIITVPNAFGWPNFKNVFRHRECINTDHRYWFTPYTLGKIVVRAGMKIESFQFCASHNRGFKDKLAGIFLKKYPALRDNLLMIVEV
jgi:hypothetical protein